MRSYSVTHPGSQVVLPQPEGWHQVLLPAEGTMTVRTATADWLLTPRRAVWAPSGVAHRIVTDGRVRVRSLYLAAELLPDPGPCRAVDVTPLVRELVLHLVARAPLWLDDPADERQVRVLADLLPGLPDASLHLPLPRDDRARRVADAIVADPGGAPAIDVLAHEAGASRRTLERIFRAETGMGLARWRTRARVLHAVRLLSAGTPVTRVAVEVGYATPSAFGAAFRHELGTTPGAVARASGAPPGVGAEAGRG